ncbi:esterase/lipase family protein [Prescottella agglutinans]|uniref:esterase/lipase family protein n=1 Tax=Prescottella agglutinans TaxID=1644129 RepID=UPI0024756014|nr:hypothetical protein [Prescottella agglutinans]
MDDEFTDPVGSATGSNDWSCGPPVEHPNPVVLVSGTGANRIDMWTTFVPLLADEGYCVYAPTYGNYAEAVSHQREREDGSRGGSTAKVGDVVDAVLAATGAARVDILSASQGSLSPDCFVRYLGQAPKVDR